MVADRLSQPTTRTEPWRLTLRRPPNHEKRRPASRPPVVRKTHPTKFFATDGFLERLDHEPGQYQVFGPNPL